ncbi:hypothetical protein BJX63DRAFT_436150 [Aspergillus granulosus]|uniref:Uncharacterized protein n=1 Tax=Aspergillus granulosus TaxID=176169 RepID=A0ABR4GYX0_9EURO
MPPGLGKAIGDPDNDEYVAQVLTDEARKSSARYPFLGTEAYMTRSYERKTPAAPKIVIVIVTVTTDSTSENHGEIRGKTMNTSTALIERAGGAAQLPRIETESVRLDGDVNGATEMTTDTDDLERVTGADPIQGHEVGLPTREIRNIEIATAPTGIAPVDAPGHQNRKSGEEKREDLVGPLPKKAAPIRSRGRGAYKSNSSNIDAHFDPNYDPALDVQLEDDDLQTSDRPTRRPVAGLMTGDDDWELALEALRDRARWKQSGEERLREAGFSTDMIDRWKSNTSAAAGEDDEGKIDGVKWSTRGEGREWDRGKFIDEDGHIDVKASW